MKLFKSLIKLFTRRRLKFKPSPPLDPLLSSKIYEINEKTISHPELSQEIFLTKNLEELSKKAEEIIVPKVLRDLNEIILEKKWCKEISKYHLNHVHLSKESVDPILDIDVLLSWTQLLYHGSEYDYSMPYFATRNIKSSVTSPPEVIPMESYGPKLYRKIGVSSDDLGWFEYGKLEFEKNPKGPYKLKDGTRLNLSGVVHTHLIHLAHLNGEL